LAQVDDGFSSQMISIDLGLTVVIDHDVFSPVHEIRE